jgi:hypothetical protein
MKILLTVIFFVSVFLCPGTFADEQNAIEQGITRQELSDTRESLEHLRAGSKAQKYGTEDEGAELSPEDIGLMSPEEAP